jgi:hypothetical protein
LQYYKCTDNGVVDDSVFKEISDQLTESRKKAVYVGSSVIAPDPNRPTAVQSTAKIPAWWSNWWLTYKGIFPQFTEDKAKSRIFVDSRWNDKTMSECSDRLVQILSSDNTTSDVKWDIL